MIDFSFLIYDAPLWFIFWVWTKVLLSDSSGNVKKNSYAYLQSLGYNQTCIYCIYAFFGPQNSSSGRDAKTSIKTLHLDMIWVKLWTVLNPSNWSKCPIFQIKINDKNWVQLFQFFRFQFWLFFAAKIQMRLFVVFQPFFCLKFHVGIFVPYFDLKNRLKNKYS